MAKSAEFREMCVANLDLGQAVRQCLAIELGVAPGPRHRSHVEKSFHTVRLQELNEGVERSRRVSDGQDERGLVGTPLAHHRWHPAPLRYRLGLASCRQVP